MWLQKNWWVTVMMIKTPECTRRRRQGSFSTAAVIKPPKNLIVKHQKQLNVSIFTTREQKSPADTNFNCSIWSLVLGGSDVNKWETTAAPHTFKHKQTPSTSSCSIRKTCHRSAASAWKTWEELTCRNLLRCEQTHIVAVVSAESRQNIVSVLICLFLLHYDV